MKDRPNLRRLREDLDNAIEHRSRTLAALMTYERKCKEAGHTPNDFTLNRLNQNYIHANAYELGLAQALYWCKGEEECDRIYQPLYEKHDEAFVRGDYNPKENE